MPKHVKLSDETRERVHAALTLANFLNEEASIAMPAIKAAKYTADEIVRLAIDDWIANASKVHVSAARKLERELFGRKKKSKKK